MTPLLIAAVAASALAAAAIAALVLPPTPRLAGRIRPYLTGDHAAVAAVPIGAGGVLRRLCAPVIDPVLRRLSSSDRDAELLRRIDHAGWFRDVAPEDRVTEWRLRQLRAGAVHAVVFAAAGMVIGSLAGLLGGAVLGAVQGAARWRGRLDKDLVTRREALCTELYTVNQLLALHIRVGGGVVQALTRVAARSRGAVADELDEIIRAHRGGRSLSDALATAAAKTAEPHAARTYLLLSSGAEHGTDLADGLRQLSADLRQRRVEDLKRSATRRRAAMLLPIIGILAPVMLLFIAAPLPRLVLGVD